MWISLSNLPRELLINISNLKQYPKNMYKSFGVYCWHGYNSNPKTIELLFNNTNKSNDDFISLGTFNLELKAGKQIFPLDFSHIQDNNITDNVKNIKYIKIIIKENYGGDWTYINQIMLYDINYHHVLKECYDNYTSLQMSSEQKSKNTENDFSISNDDKDESNIGKSKDNNNYSQNEESYLPINQNNYNEYLEQSLKREEKNQNKLIL